MRQKADEEIQAYREYEKGKEKWRREHIPRKGQGDIFELEGQELLEDKDKWGDTTSLLSACHESRKRERINEDGLFMPHQKGPITSTYTANSVTGSSGGGGNRVAGRMDEYDLGKVTEPIENAEGRFKTKKDLPEQTLGHI
jgi:hypothetical protein